MSLSLESLTEFSYTIDIYTIICIAVAVVILFLVKIILDHRKKIHRLKTKIDSETDDFMALNVDRFGRELRKTKGKNLTWSGMLELLERSKECGLTKRDIARLRPGESPEHKQNSVEELEEIPDEEMLEEFSGEVKSTKI